MKSNYKLGDLTVQRREKYSSGNFPICGVSKNGLIPPKQQEADISIYNVLYRNDFIFNPARMELNSIAFNDKYEQAICSSLYEIFYVRDTDLILPEYLQIIVGTENFRRFCAFMGSGSVREYCRYANISEYPITLPPIEVQRKLVRYNRVIASRIALKQRINDNLVNTLQTIYKKRFKNKSYNCMPLGTLCSKIGSGATPKGGKESYHEEGTSLIRSTNVFDFRFSYHDMAHIDEAQAKALDNVTVCDDDVLFNITGVSVARCCMVPANVLPARVNQHVMIIRPKAGKYMSYYLMCALCDSDNKALLLGIGQSGSTREAINKQEMEAFQIAVPSNEEIEEFSRIAETFYTQINHNDMEISALQCLRNIILSKLLNIA